MKLYLPFLREIEVKFKENSCRIESTDGFFDLGHVIEKGDEKDENIVSIFFRKQKILEININLLAKMNEDFKDTNLVRCLTCMGVGKNVQEVLFPVHPTSDFSINDQELCIFMEFSCIKRDIPVVIIIEHNSEFVYGNIDVIPAGKSENYHRTFVHVILLDHKQLLEHVQGTSEYKFFLYLLNGRKLAEGVFRIRREKLSYGKKYPDLYSYHFDEKI
ncbi:hypothetical protein HNQ34_000335 [Anoxybacillus tepidamans]|uniref:Uncharacterized protein n=1 Tax=Anoxybacteroides tepidamans TaxID=265948 RepID=A0A7W8IMJ9_9BACL|nr:MULTISPECIES: hypothetical protein [Anoxybacillus]MBB5323258.1 hypothetical protein [Anoxybacillus tepidamans]MCZ0756610.1 hypothetical protein [Anoxybacillus sp. J5B_2022]